jgi:hypothetical protein
LRSDYNILLLFGALGSGVAAILHLGCIVFGAPWYRFFGAGEKMAQLAEAGSSAPTRITSVIIVILTIWTYYALAGVGLIPKPPLLRLALAGIASIYLLRAFMVFWLMKIMPGNSVSFWLWSSAICLIFGMAYLFGTKQSWTSLK